MLQFLQDILEYIQNNKGTFVAIGIFLTTIGIEWIPKIKFNPWTSLFRWLGKQLTSDIRKDIIETNNKLDHFISETREDNQAIIRDRLLQIYHLTLRKGYILEKDSQNFHSLLDRYKANGGNSYIVHDVAPRIETFKVYLTDNDAENHYKEYHCY